MRLISALVLLLLWPLTASAYINVNVSTSPTANVTMNFNVTGNPSASTYLTVSLEDEPDDSVECSGTRFTVVRRVKAVAGLSGTISGQAQCDVSAIISFGGSADCQASSSEGDSGYGSTSIYGSQFSSGNGAGWLSGNFYDSRSEVHATPIASAESALVAAAGYAVDLAACEISLNGTALDARKAIAVVKYVEGNAGR